jgi:transposase-like protein
MGEAEIITRWRKWTAEEKAALLSEVAAEGGRVAMVPRRHGPSESVLYNWRSVANAEASGREPIEFAPVGVIDRASEARRLDRCCCLQQSIHPPPPGCQRYRDSAPERRADPRQCVGERQRRCRGRSERRSVSLTTWLELEGSLSRRRNSRTSWSSAIVTRIFGGGKLNRLRRGRIV